VVHSWRRGVSGTIGCSKKLVVDGISSLATADVLGSLFLRSILFEEGRDGGDGGGGSTIP
jgi:hypothetical protein